MSASPTNSTKPAQPEEAPVKQPINLRAVEVEARVLRIGDKSQLQTMRSQGKVHVVQAPAKKGEKGLDIQGDTTLRPGQGATQRGVGGNTELGGRHAAHGPHRLSSVLVPAACQTSVMRMPAWAL